VASYSAGGDIEAKLISEPSTGTKLDITATDQIRPVATTTAIPTIHARIWIPSTSCVLWKHMEQLQVRRLPVINKSKRMVGILSLGDLSRSASGDLLSEWVKSVSAHH